MLMNSEIILSKGIKLDRNYINVLDYTETQMLELMRSNTHYVAGSTDYSFIRQQKGVVKTSFSYLQALQSNYMAFKNPDYANKWFFAFVDNVEYKGENNTYIYYTVDSWQTWFKSLSIKPCYIIREHTNDDTIGKNTTDEGIAVQDIYGEGYYVDQSLDLGAFIVVASNWRPDTETGFNGITYYNRLISGNEYCLFPLNDTGVVDYAKFIFVTNGQGHIGDIHDVFIAPSELILSTALTTRTGTKTVAGVTVTFTYYTLDGSDHTYDFDAVTKYISLDKHYTFSDYTPKNNKLFCYPYNYLLVTNNVGSTNIYKYEDFEVPNEPNKIQFQQQLALSIGVSGRTVPLYYKHVLENIDESISLSKYPTCSWSADSYTNWLTQNAVNIDQQYMNMAFTGINSGVSAMTGNVMGLLSGTENLANQSMSLMGQFYQAQLLPNITGGQNTGDVNFASKDSGFRYMYMRAKTEFLRQIDDYFSRFGYKTLRVKTPNITGRTNFNYVEIGMNESIGYGSIPKDDETIINNACRKGVTIWHNHANLGDFTVNNSIVQ